MPLTRNAIAGIFQQINDDNRKPHSIVIWCYEEKWTLSRIISYKPNSKHVATKYSIPGHW